MTLLIALAIILILARWGGVIFLAYACWHFLNGDWFEANFALMAACFIETVQGLARWIDRPSRCCAPWQAQHGGQHNWR